MQIKMHQTPLGKAQKTPLFPPFSHLCDKALSFTQAEKGTHVPLFCMFMQQGRERFFKVFGAPSLFGGQLPGVKSPQWGRGSKKAPAIPGGFCAKYENSALAELGSATGSLEAVLLSF